MRSDLVNCQIQKLTPFPRHGTKWILYPLPPTWSMWHTYSSVTDAVICRKIHRIPSRYCHLPTNVYEVQIAMGVTESPLYIGGSYWVSCSRKPHLDLGEVTGSYWGLIDPRSYSVIPRIQWPRGSINILGLSDLGVTETYDISGIRAASWRWM